MHRKKKKEKGRKEVKVWPSYSLFSWHTKKSPLPLPFLLFPPSFIQWNLESERGKRRRSSRQKGKGGGGGRVGSKKRKGGNREKRERVWWLWWWWWRGGKVLLPCLLPSTLFSFRVRFQPSPVPTLSWIDLLKIEIGKIQVGPLFHWKKKCFLSVYASGEFRPPWANGMNRFFSFFLPLPFPPLPSPQQLEVLSSPKKMYRNGLSSSAGGKGGRILEGKREREERRWRKKVPKDGVKFNTACLDQWPTYNETKLPNYFGAKSSQTRNAFFCEAELLSCVREKISFFPFRIHYTTKCAVCSLFPEFLQNFLRCTSE